MDIKRRWKAVALAIGISIVVLMVAKAGPMAVAKAIASANLVLLAGVFLLFFAVILGKALRYAILAKRMGGDYATLMKISLAGQMFNQVNIVASDVSKALLLKKKSGLAFGRAAAPAVIERFTDIAVLTAFAAVGAIFYLNAPTVIFAVPFLLLGALALFLKVPFFRKVSQDFLGASKEIGARTTLAAVAMTSLLWLADATAFVLILNSLGMYPRLVESVAAYAVSSMVAASVFLPVGGLEASFVMFFPLLGVQTSTVLAAALIYRFVILSQLGVFGLASLKRL